MIEILESHKGGNSLYCFTVQRNTADPKQRSEFTTSVYAESEKEATEFLLSFYKYAFLSTRITLLPITVDEFNNKRRVKIKVQSATAAMLADRRERMKLRDAKRREKASK